MNNFRSQPRITQGNYLFLMNCAISKEPCVLLGQAKSTLRKQKTTSVSVFTKTLVFPLIARRVMKNIGGGGSTGLNIRQFNNPNLKMRETR